MRVGLIIFPTDKGNQPIELGREAEARGFDALWFPEHSHIPTSRLTPWGGRDGAPPLPEEYWRTHDQFSALSAIAGATEHIKLGTGITLVAQRDPIWLAKEIASLDMISNGRVLFGVGYGWNHEEMESHGVDPKTRRRLVREKVLAMKELWTKEEAEFHGEFVNFDKIRAQPKPLQRPHPPIIMGGDGPTTFDRVIEYCDGWLPIAFSADKLGERIATLKQRAADAGRDPASIGVTVSAVKPGPAIVEELARAGAERVNFFLPAAGRETVLPLLDQYAGWMD